MRLPKILVMSAIISFFPVSAIGMGYSSMMMGHRDDMGMIEAQYSEEDRQFLSDLCRKKETKINSSTLKALLEAYDDTGKTYVPQLPLELALISIIGQNA